MEIQIQKVFDYLNSAGIHCHKNHARRTIDGIFLEGEPFDYEIFTFPVHVFDAKETSTDKWPLSNAKPAQVKHLLNCRNHGAEAYFLVLFGSRDPRRFDVEFVRDAIARGRKSLDKSEGKDWDWREFK